jgi:YHS domain-containing protein
MKLPFVLALVSLLAAGCGGGAAETSPPQAPKAEAAGDVKKPGEATIGDKTSCPISKEVFTVSASSPKVDYKGKTYYFCCGGCDSKFKENPEKYLAPTASP